MYRSFRDASSTTSSGTVSSSSRAAPTTASSFGCSTDACSCPRSLSAAAGSDPGASLRLRGGDAVEGGHPGPSAGTSEEEEEEEERGAAHLVRSCCG
ncbi:hypothetical protein AALO_G00036160 [Alosa alosa]|uniref:Uncharacterized protein n=1 Tax=Alosa alosa TaxID=278164 RepID=A0AAV6H6H8_9TELE|nr:hypothetical protein AALO_G00036160 [Alosa alosa]